MDSYTIVLGFVCKACMMPNVRRVRVLSSDKDAALAQVTGIKLFCKRERCQEQVFDNEVHLQVLASTPEEFASIALESTSGSA